MGLNAMVRGLFGGFLAGFWRAFGNAAASTGAVCTAAVGAAQRRGAVDWGGLDDYRAAVAVDGFAVGGLEGFKGKRHLHHVGAFGDQL